MCRQIRNRPADATLRGRAGAASRSPAPIKKTGLHRSRAFDLQPSAGLESEGVAQCPAGGGDVDPASQTPALYAFCRPAGSSNTATTGGRRSFDDADAAAAQLLRFRRTAEEPVDFAVDEQLLRLDLRVGTQSMSLSGRSPTSAAIRSIKMLGSKPIAWTPTLLPFSSVTLRMPSRANSSTQPTITPPMTVTAAPPSMP